jgi:hypothetical protein
MPSPTEKSYIDTTKVCGPVANTFGTGPDAIEIMGWPEVASDVHTTADEVVGLEGWGEHAIPERNAIEHACATCALRGCGVRQEIESRAQAQENDRLSLEDLAYSPEVFSFMRMPQIEAMRGLQRGEPLLFPEGTLPEEISTTDLVLPRMDIVTPKGAEVSLVPLYAANRELNEMLQSTRAVLPPSQEDAIFKKAQEVLVRAVDTTGDLGVHHINGTSLGRPTYYNLDRSGRRPVVYITSLGEIEGKQIYGLLTATTTDREQLRLIKLIGGDFTKARFNRK